MCKTIRMTETVLVFGALAVLGLPTLSAQEVGVGERAYAEAAALYAAAVEGESHYPQDPADSLYRAAREMLNRNNYRRAAEMFREVHRRYPQSSYAAQSLYYQAFALYRNGRDRDLRDAERVLVQLEDQYVESESALKEAEALMARIQGELARRGDREAAEEVAAAAAGIRERESERERVRWDEGRKSAAQACESEEDEIRMAALNALMQMDSERAIPILRKVLQEEDPDNACVQQMRQTALFLVAQHLDEENVDILLDVIQNDPNPEMRQTAVFWLSQVPGERTITALMEILNESDDPEMRQQALFALGQVHDERTTQVLRDFALDESNDPEMRGLAIFWLGQRHDEGSAEFLRQVYQTTDEMELKQNILHSIAQSGDEENARWLLQIASDPNEDMEMRKLAFFWVGQSHQLSVQEVDELYDSMTDRELKEQIIFSVAQRHDEEVVDWLLDIARNEQDPELRKTVIFWLTQVDDPRVTEFLLEIIEGGN